MAAFAGERVNWALAHAGGLDEITYAVSAVVFAAAAWVGIQAVRRRREQRERGEPRPPAAPEAPGPDER